MKSTRRHSSLGLSRSSAPPSSNAPQHPLPLPPVPTSQGPSVPPVPPSTPWSGHGYGSSASGQNDTHPRPHQSHGQLPPRSQGSTNFPGSSSSSAPAVRPTSTASRYWRTVLGEQALDSRLSASASFHRSPPVRPPDPPLPPTPSTGPSSSSNSASSSQSRPSPFKASSSSRKRSYKCPHCTEEFDRRFDMRAHIAQAHKSKAVLQGYPCKDANCNKVFGHRSSRCRHEKQAHGGEQR